MSLTDPPSAGCRLARLLGLLGPAVMTVLVEPRDASALVSGTVIEDPLDPPPDLPGGLMFIIDASPEPAATLGSLRRAAAGRLTGVVLKPRGRDLGQVLALARELGLAVLAAGAEIPWRELAALVDAALWPHVADGDPQRASSGDELFAIADAVAGTTGGSVAIEDLDRHVLAYSNIPGQRIDAVRSQGILERRGPDLPLNELMYRRVRAAEGVVRYPALEDELARAAIAIRAGTLPLGTLWAIEGENGLTAEGRRAIEEGAQLASLHLLRARSASEVGEHLRGELLRSLLEGEVGTRATAHRLGLPSGMPQALLALGPGRSLPPSGPPLVARVAQSVNRHCRALHPDAAVTALNHAVFVLIGGSDPSETALRLARVLLSLLDQTVGPGICAGIAIGHGPVPDVATMRAHAEDVLRVVTSPAVATRSATVDDVREELLLLHVHDVLLREPQLRHAATVRSLGDADRRTELHDTLRAWFDARFDVRRAAQRLHVHPNTLRYRLRRFVDTDGVDLDDPNLCLCLWLQLRADAMFGSSTG